MDPIIAFAGPTKSGKTTLAKKLAATLGFGFGSFGERVRKEAARRGLRHASRKQLQTLGEEMVKSDKNTFCQEVLQDADFRPGHGLVLDGIRHIDILSLIKDLVRPQTVRLVYVESPVADRVKRNRSDLPQIQEIDSHPVERDAARLKSAADLFLDTSKEEQATFQTLLQWAKAGAK